MRSSECLVVETDERKTGQNYLTDRRPSVFDKPGPQTFEQWLDDGTVVRTIATGYDADSE